MIKLDSHLISILVKIYIPILHQVDKHNYFPVANMVMQNSAKSNDLGSLHNLYEVETLHTRFTYNMYMMLNKPAFTNLSSSHYESDKRRNIFPSDDVSGFIVTTILYTARVDIPPIHLSSPQEPISYLLKWNHFYIKTICTRLLFTLGQTFPPIEINSFSTSTHMPHFR
jgi:hypothetical protein